MAGRFIGAPDPAHEIVFTKNTTESLNLVAHSWGRANLRRGDAVLLTEMEHHANIVPWLMLSEELGGLDLRYIPIDGVGPLGPRPTSTASSTGPRSWRCRPCRTCSAPSTRCALIAEAAHREPAPWWWPTAPSSSRTRRST